MSNATGIWTSEEVALVLIDYQEEMFANVKSETTADEIELTVKFLIRAAKALRAAVKKTGKKRLIFGALYTEICLAFPVLDATRDGFEVMFMIDAVGGMSQLAHRTVIERLTAAGAVPNTSLALVTELFRDWKSPIADKAREVIKWYMPEAQKLAMSH
jgi:nicotinamidase-related amidase